MRNEGLEPKKLGLGPHKQQMTKLKLEPCGSGPSSYPLDSTGQGRAGLGQPTVQAGAWGLGYW